MSDTIMDQFPQTSVSAPPLGYNPEEFPRELVRHYAPASDTDIRDMLEVIGEEKLEDLFSHIPQISLFYNQKLIQY